MMELDSFLMAPKCDHKYPHNKEAAGGFTQKQRKQPQDQEGHRKLQEPGSGFRPTTPRGAQLLKPSLLTDKNPAELLSSRILRE